MPYAQSNERVDPFERAGPRHGARTRPLQAKIAKINGGVDREGEIKFLVPVSRATKQIEGRR